MKKRIRAGDRNAEAQPKSTIPALPLRICPNQGIGFDPETVNPAGDGARRLGWIFGPGVGGLLVVGAVLLFRFPLSDEGRRRIQMHLAERRTPPTPAPEAP